MGRSCGDLKRMKYREMADMVEAVENEIQRRNPIGVNFYTPAIHHVAELIREISRGEKDNFTSEAGPHE
jgi:hypothetical protein